MLILLAGMRLLVLFSFALMECLLFKRSRLLWMPVTSYVKHCQKWSVNIPCVNICNLDAII